jgi:hypothetical protein
MKMNAGLRDDLTKLARYIESQIWPFGFALFVQKNRVAAYVSNARREDVQKMFREWLKKSDREIREIQKQLSTLTDKEEFEPYIDPETAAQDPFESYDRVRLQRMCAKLGEEIGAKSNVLLFLFHFEPGGSMAYWVNVPNARQVVADWVAGRRL